MVAEQKDLQPDYQEDMTVAQYFQKKLDTRENLENMEAPEFCYSDINKLVESILHTENMEEKTGILNEAKLKEMLVDENRLKEMLSEKHLRRDKISDLINEMILEQRLQQELIRQELELLRNELVHSKNLIEQLTQGQGTNAPAMDSNLVRSKVYQVIGNVDSLRRDLSFNIANVRSALAQKSEEAMNSFKEFAMKPVKAVSGFFSRIKDTVLDMKNSLYSSVESAKEFAVQASDQAKNNLIKEVSTILDASANSLLELKDYINGNVPEHWKERLTLSSYVKDLVERNVPEPKILKEIKRFCSDTSLGKSEAQEAKKYMKELLSQRGIAQT